MDTPEVLAEITFYKSNQIVDIVNDYLTEIFGEDEPRIYSISEISRLAERNLEKRLDLRNVRANSCWPHLKNYIEHISEFAHELGTDKERVITVGKDQIESYVAQYSRDDHSIRYYKYLAVKKADIRCCFPSYEVCGKIVLVDTIGLGDTAIGVEEEMIRAIREDSDAIIYMLRPDIKRPIIEANHYEIIEEIAKKISVEYAKEMLFWVINRDMSEGEHKGSMISKLAGQLEDNRKKNAIPICKALDVNCMDQVEVNQELLTPVMQQMSDRLEEIDNLLIARSQKKLDEMYEFYERLSGQVQRAYSKMVSQNVTKVLNPQIKSTLGNWQGQLKDLCDNRRKSRDSDNERFSEGFENNLKRVLTSLPTKKEVQTYRKRRRGFETKHETFIRITEYIRNQVIDHFLGLDKILDELVRELKLEIVHILADNDKGKMGAVVPLTEGQNPDEWLDALIQIVDQNEFSRIRKSILELRNFSMSVKAFFIFPVRSGLDPIDMDEHDNINIEGDDSRPEDLAENMYALLESSIYDVRNKIKTDCKNYLLFPNSALYAAARDFRDRSVFAVTEMQDEAIGIKDEWQYFYEDHIVDIWPTECAKHAQAHQMNEEFNHLLKSIKNACQRNHFQI